MEASGDPSEMSGDLISTAEDPAQAQTARGRQAKPVHSLEVAGKQETSTRSSLGLHGGARTRQLEECHEGLR